MKKEEGEGEEESEEKNNQRNELEGERAHQDEEGAGGATLGV